jgi:hypothetical protein
MHKSLYNIIFVNVYQSFELECLSKAHVFKAYSQWCYWVEVEPL